MKRIIFATALAALALPVFAADNAPQDINVYEEILKNAESLPGKEIGKCDADKTVVTIKTDNASFEVATGTTGDGYMYHHIISGAGTFNVEEHDGVKVLMDMGTLNENETHAPNFVHSLKSGLKGTDCKKK